jgi:hypothetical protein
MAQCDTRGDAAGDGFNGVTIEIVNIHTGRGARGIVPGTEPIAAWLLFIRTKTKSSSSWDPENPTPDWQYGMYHRQRVIVERDLSKTLVVNKSSLARLTRCPRHHPAILRRRIARRLARSCMGRGWSVGKLLPTKTT